MNILLIDNFDSFTYNIVDLLRSISGVKVVVVKNNEIRALDISIFDKIIISPGPDVPSSSSDLMYFLRKNYILKPILGICLGHQAIAELFGAQLKNFSSPLHGEQSLIEQNGSNRLFKNIPLQFKVGLYHSWYVSEENFPSTLRILAMSEHGIIMALRHKYLPIFGVQFHPESFMTEYGKKLISNFLFEVKALA